MHSVHSESDVCGFFLFLIKMAESCTRPRSYERIKEEQWKILSNYYNKGMTTTANNMEKTIEEAATEANLSTVLTE